MGITTSKNPKTENFESNPGNYQIPSEKVEDSFQPEPFANSPIDWEDPERATSILMLKELYALFPSKLEDETDETERFMEYNEQITEFLKGGDCKELAVALEDCCNNAKVSDKECDEPFSKLWDCMFSHPKYYQPYITAVENANQEMLKHGYKSRPIPKND